MKIAFFGTPAFAVPTLRRIIESHHDVVLVVAQPDRPAGRGMKMMKPPVAQIAIDERLALEQPARIDEGFIERVRDLNPDVAVVVAYGRILPRRLLDAVRGGFINVHASLLPRWRGAAPIQRAIEAGETVTGVAIMRIDEELDHGPVFATREVAIGPDDRAPELFDRLGDTGADLLIEVLDAIERGEASEAPQEHARATVARKIRKEEGLVQWSAPARILYDRFRAFYPWPGLTAEVGGERMKVADVKGVVEATAPPGRIVEFRGGAAVIATAEDALLISSLQRPGKRAADAADVLRGMNLGPGDLLQ